MKFELHVTPVTMRLILIWPLVLVCLLLPSTAQQSPASKTASTTKEKKLVALESAGWKLVELLKDGDPKTLPGLCWERGVTVDLDGTTVSPAELRKMLAKKDWFYCTYFDSECLQRGKQSENKRYSYRDMLRKAAAVHLSVSERRSQGHEMGIVTLQIEGGPAKSQLEKWDYNFVFLFDKGEWKITCFACDPETYFS